MATVYPTPPTFALPVIVNEQSGDNQFNPIWLQWFLQLAQFLSSTGTGRLRDIIVVTASGTYVASNGTNNILALAWGGGGGGGNGVVTGVGQVSVGGGGGAGAFAMQLFTTAFNNLPFSIGGGGGSGTDGGATTFSTLTASGGRGGVSGALVTGPGFTPGGAGGTSNGLVSGNAAAGMSGLVLSLSSLMSGQGASSIWGQGGLPVASGSGQNALGYAAGGSGGANLPSAVSLAPGGSGGQGLGLIMELS